jgi:hypothetical protein
MELESLSHSQNKMAKSEILCLICQSMFLERPKTVDKCFDPLRTLRGIFIQMQKNIGFDEERRKFLEILYQEGINFCGLCYETLLEYDNTVKKLKNYHQNFTSCLRKRISDQDNCKVERAARTRNDKRNRSSGLIPSNSCQTFIKLSKPTFDTLKSNVCSDKEKEDLSIKIIQDTFSNCQLKFDQSTYRCIHENCSIKVNKIIEEDSMK